MPHDVFISHSSGDKLTADATVAALEADGIRCWVAPRDVTPGVQWADSIVRAITACRLMVLVFSSETNDSDHIVREVELAAHHRKPIIPLRVENAVPCPTLDYYIAGTHWLDAMDPPLEHHLERLSAVVKDLLERDGVAQPASSGSGGGPEVVVPASGSAQSEQGSAMVAVLAPPAPPLIPAPPALPVDLGVAPPAAGTMPGRAARRARFLGNCLKWAGLAMVLGWVVGFIAFFSHSVSMAVLTWGKGEEFGGVSVYSPPLLEFVWGAPLIVLGILMRKTSHRDASHFPVPDPQRRTARRLLGLGIAALPLVGLALFSFFVVTGQIREDGATVTLGAWVGIGAAVLGLLGALGAIVSGVMFRVGAPEAEGVEPGPATVALGAAGSAPPPVDLAPQVWAPAAPMKEISVPPPVEVEPSALAAPVEVEPSKPVALPARPGGRRTTLVVAIAVGVALMAAATFAVPRLFSDEDGAQGTPQASGPPSLPTAETPSPTGPAEVKDPGVPTVRPAQRLRAFAMSATEVRLIWDRAPHGIEVDRYIIFRDGERIATVPEPKEGTIDASFLRRSFLDDSAQPARTYTYRIVAVGVDGSRATSKEVSVTTETAPAAPPVDSGGTGGGPEPSPTCSAIDHFNGEC